MDAENLNVYESCDKAIRIMDRENLEAFGKLKLAKWDEVNVIRTVKAVYTASAKRARKRYRDVGFDAYLLAMMLCEEDAETAYEMAKKAITDEWIDSILKDTDFVTLYRFDAEMERKAYRLAEALEATPNRNAEIDKALRYWVKQVGQYAINVTDYAMMQAYEDEGVEKVKWVTQHDERVCQDCRPRDGEVYPIDEVPAKHWQCRCVLIPVVE